MKPEPDPQPAPDQQTEISPDRRKLLTTIGTLFGAGALAGCASESSAGAPSGRIMQAVSGAGAVQYVSAIGLQPDTASANLRYLGAPGTSYVPNAGDLAVALGFAAPGDGGGGLFYWAADPTTPPADDGGTVVVPGGAWTIAIGSSPTSASYTAPPARTGSWRRLYDGPINVRWFGAKGDGTTLDDGAFWLAIESFPNPPGVSYSRGPSIYVPPGTYNLAATVVIDKQVHLSGANGMGPFPSSILQWNSDVTGIFVTGSTLGGSWDALRGDGSVIDNLYLVNYSHVARVGTTATNPGACGVLVHARARIESCFIASFSGAGIAIVGSPGEHTNANNCSVSHCLLQACDHGLTICGADANAGTFTAVQAIGNRECGFWDASFLGNAFIACHAEANSVAYRTEAASTYSTFIGCYCEAGQDSQVMYPSLVLGGGLSSENNLGNALCLHGSTFASTTQTAQFVDTVGTPALQFIPLLNDPVNRTAFAWKTDGGNKWRMVYQPNQNASPPNGGWYHGCWALAQDLTLAFPAFALLDDLSWQPWTGLMWTPRGLLVGSRGGGPGVTPGVWMTSGSWPTYAPGASPPWAADPHLRGDVVFNQAPANGKPAGWVCIESGTPGTWTAFGVVGTLFNSGPIGPVTSSSNVATTTVNVAGAVPGDAVSVGHSAITSGGILMSGAVTATGVVTVTFFQPGATAISIPAGNITASVTQHV